MGVSNAQESNGNFMSLLEATMQHLRKKKRSVRACPANYHNTNTSEQKRVAISIMLARITRRPILHSIICKIRAATTQTMATSPRMTHASIQVADLEQQIDYYTKHFGMTLLSKNSKHESAMLGFGPSSFAVECVQSKGPMDLGTGFGHFGLVLPVSRRLLSQAAGSKRPDQARDHNLSLSVCDAQDVYVAVERIKAEGGKVR